MRKLALAIVILSIQTGCSYLRSEQRLDLAPFAENTISLAAEIEYGMTESSRLVNLRELWDDPAIIEHRMTMTSERMPIMSFLYSQCAARYSRP